MPQPKRSRARGLRTRARVKIDTIERYRLQTLKATPDRQANVAADKRAASSLSGSQPPIMTLASLQGFCVPYVVRENDTFEAIAARFDIPPSRLEAANPELNDPERLFAGQVINLPLGEPSLPESLRLYIPYIVQPGDTWQAIADRFGVREAALQQANPFVDPGMLIAGLWLFIPTVDDAPGAGLAAQLYTAREGDTLYEIGRNIGIGLAAMLAANPQLREADRIHAGELLVIPIATVPDQPLLPGRRYIVQSGDDWASIARRFEIAEQQLMAYNAHLPRPEAGLVVLIPEAEPAPEAPEGCRPRPLGRLLPLGEDGSVFVEFEQGFRFPFYGIDVSDGIYVNANGNVTLFAGDGEFIPFVDFMIEGPPRIAPFWSDLSPQESPADGGVYVDFRDDGRTLVVTWDRVPHFTDPTALQTFQAMLSADGTITFCYWQLTPLQPGLRTLVGVGRGEDSFFGNVFKYDADANPRRLGPRNELTPQGDLTQLRLQYRFDPEIVDYRMSILD